MQDNADERYSAEFNKNESSLTFFDGGYTVNLLKDLQGTLNFTIVAVSGTDYISDASANNTVGGIGAQLLNHDGDLVISMSYALDFRLKYLSPTIPFNKDRSVLFYKLWNSYLNNRNYYLFFCKSLVSASFSVNPVSFCNATYFSTPLQTWFG